MHSGIKILKIFAHSFEKSTYTSLSTNESIQRGWLGNISVQLATGYVIFRLTKTRYHNRDIKRLFFLNFKNSFILLCKGKFNVSTSFLKFPDVSVLKNIYLATHKKSRIWCL